MTRWRAIVVIVGGLAGTLMSAAPASALRCPEGSVTVVVDAGHGGQDRGVEGPNGLLEKDLTLKLARIMRQEAETMKCLRVRLTRDQDETLSWSKRRQASQGADLWISLHLNADLKGKARGPRVFYPTPGLEDDEVAEAHRKSTEVEAILQDMKRLEWINESVLLAVHIQRALETTWGVEFRPARSATLLGIGTLGIECPAVLVEVGFLSNQADRRGLLDPDRTKRLARAILRGIRSFLQDPRRGE